MLQIIRICQIIPETPWTTKPAEASHNTYLYYKRILFPMIILVIIVIVIKTKNKNNIRNKKDARIEYYDIGNKIVQMFKAGYNDSFTTTQHCCYIHNQAIDRHIKPQVTSHHTMIINKILCCVRNI